MKGWALRAALFGLTCLIFLELLLRFALPATERPLSVRTPDGFLLYDAKGPRSGESSYGRLPLVTYSWRINDQGWNSPVDFLPPDERQRPLIALIGDSTVEGLTCDQSGSIASALRELLAGRFAVYEFGRGGQPLSQMVLLMERVDSLYSPDVFIIVIGQETLRISVEPETWPNDYSYVVPRDSVLICVESASWERRGCAELALRSALARYMVFHVRASVFPLIRFTDAEPNMAEGLSEEEVEARMRLAGSLLLDSISEILGERELVLAMDHFVARYRIYEGESSPFVSGMHVHKDYRMLEELGRDCGSVSVVRLDEWFRRAHLATGRRFESSDRIHLNSAGNRVVAEALVETMERRGILRELPAGAVEAGGSAPEGRPEAGPGPSS